jgi:hypothetical protein
MAKKVVLFDEANVPEAFPYDGTAILQTEAEFAVEFPSLATSSASIAVKDEGSTPIGPGDGLYTTLNFTGAGVTVTENGVDSTQVDIDIPGGGSPSATTVEVDFGSTPVWSGKFTITDAAISATSKVLCWQAPGPYTGKGARADEAEMQPVEVIAVEPGSGSAVVKWQTPPMLVEINAIGRLAPNFGGGTAANSGTNRDILTKVNRLGKVRGNVKFSYLVLS